VGPFEQLDLDLDLGPFEQLDLDLDLGPFEQLDLDLDLGPFEQLGWPQPDAAMPECASPPPARRFLAPP
jgi:hypothetical protein